MAGAEHNMNFLWDLVFFKVEETVFARPRGEFERSSEVFADMFRLPSGSPEGRDKEHPIVLEGYKKEEFNCLLKVMYPTSYSLISGTNIALHLVKEEWISVLKLSTIWNMSQIREYAIHMLSTDLTLVPIEKIQLARAHKVSKWLEEGIVSLVNGDHRLTREDLPMLGYDTAALVLLIRDQSPKPGALRFNKNSIKCANCSTSNTLLNGKHTCYYCRRILVEDEEFSVLPGSIVAGIPSERLVNIASIRCSSCNNAPFYGMASVYCSGCGSYTGYSSNVRVMPKKMMDEMTKEIFGAEIEEYKEYKSTTHTV